VEMANTDLIPIFYQTDFVIARNWKSGIDASISTIVEAIS